MQITHQLGMELANIAYDIVAQNGNVTVELLQRELMCIMGQRNGRGGSDMTYMFPEAFLKGVITIRETHDNSE